MIYRRERWASDVVMFGLDGVDSGGGVARLVWEEHIQKYLLR